MHYRVQFFRYSLVVCIADFFEKPEEDYLRDIRDSINADYFDICRLDDNDTLTYED